MLIQLPPHLHDVETNLRHQISQAKFDLNLTYKTIILEKQLDDKGICGNEIVTSLKS
jgi:hypothetical protein